MFSFLLNLVGQTLRRPKRAAETVLALDLDRNALWSALGLVSVVSVLFTEFTMLFVPSEMIVEDGPFPSSPLLLGLVIWGLLVVSVFITHYIGRAFDGRGELKDSLKTVIWMQVVLLALQVVQIALFLISPVIAILFGWVGALYVFYIFLEFVRALHGFRSLGLVLAGAVVSLIGLMFGIALAIGLIAGIFGLELGANV
ncbi:Yip1 domain-containing protein [Litoreibacter ascidiaceicola]|uniref:Yip1 domain-containing protein n=1 Tax=Litoreibacter ascidiaceicola TaxID=1486859 RepID=A0A1M4VXA2_9RHOB|nr:Yip1 family protein [Litoreibacter ascidiaceicola]SHE73352.1 Yip1 domain-containing protein [Litoreibacter ascidiaceicola]